MEFCEFLAVDFLGFGELGDGEICEELLIFGAPFGAAEEADLPARGGGVLLEDELAIGDSMVGFCL